MTSDKLYSVTELADEFGITPRAIRFYETKGLLSPQRAGSTRVYTYRDRARLVIILRAKRLGFSLAEVKDYLDLYDKDTSQVEQLQLLVQNTRKRIDELERQREDLETTLGELREIESQALGALESQDASPRTAKA